MEIKYKLIKKHLKHCTAVKAVEDRRWNTPWWIPGRYVTRDSIGRKNGGAYQWLVLECNCCSCDAVAIIKIDDILSILGGQIR